MQENGKHSSDNLTHMLECNNSNESIINSKTDVNKNIQCDSKMNIYCLPEQSLSSKAEVEMDCQDLTTNNGSQVPLEERKDNTEGAYEVLEKSDINDESLVVFDSKTSYLISNPDTPQKSIGSDELLEKITYQQKIIDQNNVNVKFLEEKCAKLDGLRKELEVKFEIANRQKESAIKEKENMVIRYAVGEKNVIKERQQKEQVEKKLKELQKDNELLQHKLQTMISEKARICQMLDNKCYEHKNLQLEMDKTKQDMNNLETKLKWNQNSLKTEIEAHRECQAKVESLTAKVQESANQIDMAKKNAEDTIKSFMTSQENRAYSLDQQVKEQQASLILLRHEKVDRDQQIKTLQSELERLQSKQKDMIEENNSLSLKVQQLERERLESEQKLSELRGCQDQHRQDSANLQTKHVQLEQLKLQLKHEHDQLLAANEQMDLLKQRNQELESDMEACRVREAELLLFTQQLTDKNVRLQSEFTAMETKVQQLTGEQNLLKRQQKEQQTKMALLSSTSAEERVKRASEIESLSKNYEETKSKLEETLRELGDQKGENLVMKRKYDLSLRELNKELQQCRKKLEHVENHDSSTNTSNSSSSLNVNGHSQCSSDTEQVKVVQPEATIDKQALIEHIVKLQRISAKKSEKIDFLEEHVNTLVAEVQKKTKLLQGYILREQTGTLTSNKMDNNKAQLAKLNGVMASVYSSKVCDENLTLELSLDIIRKLQAVVEDVLLKNITLKENVDTLGNEIDRLNTRLNKVLKNPDPF